MPTLSSGHAIVCGLAAQSLKISMARPLLDVTRHDALYVNLTPGPPVIHAEFEFMLRPEELALYERKFQVGDGVFYRHDLGPADVCEYCGTAWLPGTVACPACAGRTTYANRAIEYAARNTGVIENKALEIPLGGLARLRVAVRFFELTWPSGGAAEVFRHDLWQREPALWICQYCGHVAHGKSAQCPGCAGRRQPSARLATQQRECLWCGAQTVGGYACRRCNMRLKAGQEAKT